MPVIDNGSGVSDKPPESPRRAPAGGIQAGDVLPPPSSQVVLRVHPAVGRRRCAEHHEQRSSELPLLPLPLLCDIYRGPCDRVNPIVPLTSIIVITEDACSRK